MSRKAPSRVVRRFALLTLALPAAVVVVGLTIDLSTSAPGAARLSIGLTVLLGFGLPAAIGVACLVSLRQGARGPAFRLFGAQALGLSVLLTIVTTLRLPAGLAVGLPAGVAVGVVGWFVQRTPPRGATPPDVVPLDLTSSERAAWMRTASLPVPAVVLISGVVLILALKAGLGWASGDHGGGAIILTIVVALLIALIAATAVFRVRVDSHGLTVRSLLGLPRFRVDSSEIGTVTVVDSSSLGVRGSWGIRVFPNRVTIVTRSTTGISVTRRDGRTFFVTVDDAARGASLLEDFATQNRG